MLRITALWAFSECALGGIMHALHLPFTGLFVGGFSVLCIGLLAHSSGRNAAAILRATLLVILVKAVVSPHSPPPSYLAVGFQGVSGALILSYIKPFGLAARLFGCLAILESAVQKLLMLLLFFGKSLFEALDLFVNDVLETFGLHSQVSWSTVIVCSYVGLYALWGLLLGWWITRLPAQIERRTAEYTAQDFSEKTAPDTAAPVAKRRRQKWIGFVLLLAFVVLTFLLAGDKASGGQKAFYAVLRTIAALAAWFFLAQPIALWFFRRWAAKRSEAERGDMQQIIDFMPDLRSQTVPIYRYVAQKHPGWRRWPEFVLAMFVVAMGDRRA